MLPRFAPLALALATALLAASAGLAASPALTIVVWAPGYPGTTDDAQATMDDFARTLEGSASWRGRRALGAIYHETLEGGRSLLEGGEDAAAAFVPLPLFLDAPPSLTLEPLLQGEPLEGGTAERWSLVARRGALSRSADLDGWEITGLPGYAPGFVRRVLGQAWGAVPPGTRITFEKRVVGALRRAASGERVAVLLDEAQARSLPSLPFARELEVVSRSAPLPGNIFCAVGGRLDDGEREALVTALLQMHRDPAGREVLKTMRLKRFRALDAAPLASLSGTR